jgi:hypothetical protein
MNEIVPHFPLRRCQSFIPIAVLDTFYLDRFYRDVG